MGTRPDIETALAAYAELERITRAQMAAVRDNDVNSLCSLLDKSAELLSTLDIADLPALDLSSRQSLASRIAECLRLMEENQRAVSAEVEAVRRQCALIGHGRHALRGYAAIDSWQMPAYVDMHW